MISVLSQLTNTFGPWLFEFLSIYLKLPPIGGRLVAPILLDGLFVFVDRIKFCVLPALFLSLHFILHCCNRYLPLLGVFIIVVSVKCILLYLVRLYVSFPTETLR